MNFAVANHPVVPVVIVIVVVVHPHRRRQRAHKTNFERSFGCCAACFSFHFLLAKVFGAQPVANGGSARIQNPGRESRIPNSDSESYTWVCSTRKFAPLLICCCCCCSCCSLVHTKRGSVRPICNPFPNPPRRAMQMSKTMQIVAFICCRFSFQFISICISLHNC